MHNSLFFASNFYISEVNSLYNSYSFPSSSAYSSLLRIADKLSLLAIDLLRFLLSSSRCLLILAVSV